MSKSDITTAMVLAAGLGKRMRPLTDDKPKPMVPFNGRPLIDHVLTGLANAGITRAVVNVHYLGSLLIDHLATTTHPQIAISDERGKLLDTGGGIVNALDKIGSAPFIVHNSDSVWYEQNSNIAALLNAWNPQRMDALLMLADGQSSIGYAGKGDFHIAPDTGRLTRCRQGETSPDVYCGVCIMKPESFRDQSPLIPMSLNAIWDELIAKERLYGMRMEGLWMHIGDPDALTQAEATLSPYPVATS